MTALVVSVVLVLVVAVLSFDALPYDLAMVINAPGLALVVVALVFYLALQVF